jgi:hypothetical protein
MRDYPMSHMFGTSMMAADGRVTAYKPSGLTEDEKTREIAIEAEMFHQASRIDWDIRALHRRLSPRDRQGASSYLGRIAVPSLAQAIDSTRS